MQINPSIVAERYAALRQATAPDGGEGPGALIGQAASDFAATLARSEQTATAAMQGSADPHALVQALTQTELAVETAVTIRNKVVEAYQEILRMPV